MPQCLECQKLSVLNDQGIRHNFQNNPINLSAIKQEVQIVPIFMCVSTGLQLIQIIKAVSVIKYIHILIIWYT